MYYQTEISNPAARFKNLELLHTNLHGKAYNYYMGSRDPNTLILINDGLLKIHSRPFLVINYFDDRSAAANYLNSFNNPESDRGEDGEFILKHFIATMKYIPGGHKALFMNNAGSWLKIKDYK